MLMSKFSKGNSSTNIVKKSVFNNKKRVFYIFQSCIMLQQKVKKKKNYIFYIFLPEVQINVKSAI